MSKQVTLSEFNGTPGPWVVIESSLSVSVVGQNGEAVFHESDKRIPGVMDDARLIAAAPDLLEALIMCYQSMSSVLPDFNPFDQSAYDKARAAITKATGEKDE